MEYTELIELVCDGQQRKCMINYPSQEPLMTFITEKLNQLGSEGDYTISYQW